MYKQTDAKEEARMHHEDQPILQTPRLQIYWRNCSSALVPSYVYYKSHSLSKTQARLHFRVGDISGWA